MGGNSAAGVTAHFLEGIVITCVFGIPSVMVHTEVVSPHLPFGCLP